MLNINLLCKTETVNDRVKVATHSSGGGNRCSVWGSFTLLRLFKNLKGDHGGASVPEFCIIVYAFVPLLPVIMD